ncbi:hypothetical protein [Streptomyces javensis]|uniref:Uncharacterized protein n=1 Tax=Streptomyces javensis TaxID=114698 RepID=A0ABS0R5Q9_9ACTN|nr:hypothetical protein [Streptomyces javensis]MBI0312708.1 hypothetical protein [Streptomyces javensis]
MNDTEYNFVFFTHVGGDLLQAYGSRWPEDLQIAVGVFRSVAHRLTREEFTDFVDCVCSAVQRRKRRPHQLLPDTLLTHLYEPLSVRFGVHPGPGIALASKLVEALHQSLPEEMFETLLDALRRTVGTMEKIERRRKSLRAV